MRSMLAATWMIAALSPAIAQTPPAVTKPKPVATIAVRPAIQTPADTANAMAQAERQSIQSDLAWAGHFNGAITGEVSERMVTAIKDYQKSRGAKPTGVLNPQERGMLADAARKAQEQVGWKFVQDPVTGARVGVPGKLAPQMVADAAGTRWSSTTGTIQIAVTRRKEANTSTAKLAEREKKEPAGRRIDYSAVKPDFFVLSGMQGLKKFYLRGQTRGDEVRILTILYDQATEGTMEPVVIAMSSAFNPFPTGAQPGPPPRKTVEYATGVVVSADGAILTDRLATDGCLSLLVAGRGQADRIADDKERDLALLRIYGARDLRPLGLGGGTAKAAVDITGIADPQSQGGGAAVTLAKAQIGGSATEPLLAPAPGNGFSGAPVRDADGAFAGVTLLKPVQVAGPTPSPPPALATLAPADGVRAFLRANNVTTSDAPAADPRSAVVRVICVRK